MHFCADDHKRAVLEGLLTDSMVQVMLDARSVGVHVPPGLRKDGRLRLNLSHRFAHPLLIDDHAVTATLTFGDFTYACVLPWSAIYLFVPHNTGDPHVFLDSLPPDLQIAEEGAALPSTETPVASNHGACASDTATAAPQPLTEETQPPPENPPKRRGHLRVVK
jgi:stringent starvation protein B